jgi:hypothetical protein
MQHLQQPRPLARGVKRSEAYAARPPSPPYIFIPAPVQNGTAGLSLMPSFDNVDSSQLTAADLAIITQDKTQLAKDSAASWRYESRRQAQPVLDFLYLGPSSVLRDHAFLQREGITMLLGIRDSRLAQANLMGARRAAQALGLESSYVDVASNQELVRAAPVAVKMINDHMLSVYRSQAIPQDGSTIGGGGGGGGVDDSDQQNQGGVGGGVQHEGQQQQQQQQSLPGGQMIVRGDSFRRGRVLVYCETGNDRSAAIVAAYIMAVFGVDLVHTLQFVGLQRFCTNFDDETKYWLKSYEDILNARRSVQRVMGGDSGQARGQGDASSQNAATSSKARGKRGIEDTMDVDDDRETNGGNPTVAASALDMDRYVNRNFVPFVQKAKDTPTADTDDMMGE